MSELPSYLVAKYVSDLQRMEPKNIGVIVWTPSAVSARFAAEKPNKPGEIDGRSIPAFVTSMAAYKQWVDFWRSELNTKPLRAGKILRKWSDNLRQSSWGNFWLAEGGTILDDVRSDDVEGIADDLFRKLVDPVSSDDGQDVALDRVADDVIRRLRLSQNANFHSRYR